MSVNERWQRVKQLFQTVLELLPEQRQRFLDKFCAGNDASRQDIESLLVAHEKSPNILDKPALSDRLLEPETDSNQTMIGKTIGPYKLIKEIGRGGMGLVYLARRADELYQKQVAIKIIKRGMDTDDIIKRFCNERQILAALDHPNIARLLDGGCTDDGLPYFIMEYIEGLPIHSYCDVRRLTIMERLKLFQIVCSAVHYAHQNLIVHRDLKPNNLLVTSDGVPKLLDFGIAKLLHPEFELHTIEATKTGMRFLTPYYASPEQIRGDPITTASDVYSLGILLYVLLTGHHAYCFENCTPKEIEHKICDEEPERPSLVIKRVEEMPDPDNDTSVLVTPELVSKTREGNPDKLRRRLMGDIDNIIMKALRKEPQRRYASVEQFSEDIQRHLSGFPVIARKDTLYYRNIKFIKRHKAGVLAGSIILLSLIVGVILTTWQSRLARQHRDLSLQIANSMIHELAQGLKNMPGPTESRIGLLKKAENVFHQINQLGYDTPDLKRQMAEANRFLAETYRILGEKNRALRCARDGELQARNCMIKGSKNLQNKTVLASNLLELGDVLVEFGQEKEAMTAYQESQQLFTEMLQNSPDSLETVLQLSIVKRSIGDRLYCEGRLKEADSLYQQSFQLTQQLLEKDKNNLDFLVNYTTSLERVGDIFYATGKVERSCEKYRQALTMRQRAFETAPNNPNVLKRLALALQNVGWCEEQEQKIDEAIRRYEESIAIQKRLVAIDPSNTILVSNLMGGLGTIGAAYLSKGEVNEAIRHYRQAYDLGKSRHDSGQSKPALDAKTAAISQLLADALCKQHQFQNALQVLNFSSSILEELMENDPADLEYPRSLAYTVTSRGDVLYEQGKYQEAKNNYEQALTLRKRVAYSSGISLDKQLEAFGCYKLGTSLLRMAQPDEARKNLLMAKKILCELREAGQLSDTSEGYRLYLPQIEQALKILVN